MLAPVWKETVLATLTPVPVTRIPSLNPEVSANAITLDPDAVVQDFVTVASAPATPVIVIIL